MDACKPRPAFASLSRARCLRVCASAGPSKMKLFDMPVSNHGARVRYVVYTKGLESEIEVVPPSTCGGLKSEQYLALNPQGKMPLLLLPDGVPVPESEAISMYLIDKFESRGPAFKAPTPELRARAALITRYMDLYVHTIQGCMYKKMDSAADRARDIQQLKTQLNNLEALAVEGGPLLLGEQVTGADAALLPTFVFMDFMLPTHFGWKDGVFAGRPKLGAWFKHITTQDAAGKKVADEVRGGLQSWEEKQRWKELGIDEQVAKHPELQWA